MVVKILIDPIDASFVQRSGRFVPVKTDVRGAWTRPVPEPARTQAQRGEDEPDEPRDPAVGPTGIGIERPGDGLPLRSLARLGRLRLD